MSKSYQLLINRHLMVIINNYCLQIERLGGNIGDVNVTWQIVGQTTDFLQDQGVISLLNGQTTANLDLKVRGDSIPELDETFLVQLVSASKVVH